MEVRRSSPVPSVVVTMRVVCCAFWLICRTLPVGCGSCRAAYEDSTKECKGLLETIDDLEQMVGAHIAGLFHFPAHLSTDRVDRSGMVLPHCASTNHSLCNAYIVPSRRS